MPIQKLLYNSKKISGLIIFHHQLQQLREVFNLATDITCRHTLWGQTLNCKQFDHHVVCMIKPWGSPGLNPHFESVKLKLIILMFDYQETIPTSLSTANFYLPFGLGHYPTITEHQKFSFLHHRTVVFHSSLLRMHWCLFLVYRQTLAVNSSGIPPEFRRNP